MLTITIICIGKLKEKYLQVACEEYSKRLKIFCKLNIVELSEYKLPNTPNPAQIEKAIQKEGEAILAACKAKGYHIALCIEGKQLSSEQLAKQFSQVSLEGMSEIVLIIGGSYGLAEAVKQKADFKLSMSLMTFPHQLARVMLLEQVYRAFQISSNGKYHK